MLAVTCRFTTSEVMRYSARAQAPGDVSEDLALAILCLYGSGFGTQKRLGLWEEKAIAQLVCRERIWTRISHAQSFGFIERG
jgi:hypothetical protein